MKIHYGLAPLRVRGLERVQLHAEPASFNRVMAIMQRLSRDGSGAEQARVDALARWGKAAGALRGKRAEQLVMEKFGGYWPEEDTTPSPDQFISIYFYGEHVHWANDKATRIEQWAKDPFDEDFYRYRFLESVAPLAHLYMLFAVFIAHVMRASGQSIAA